ncbi:MAG: leucine-rich repeat protein, partial [Lachnospiraceae bacterium]|nr:leucine-rich repeat protein [Lachnospiraceae bacterium]
MSNSNNKSTSMKVSGKRKKFRMRKRARRTVASLLLVSALVISLIPTQQKTQAYVDPDESVLAIDKVIEKYALHSEADTEVKQGTKNIAYAFPCTGEAPEIIGDHKYFKIDMTGMTKKDETPVPVYNISTADTDCTLNLFYGYDLPFNGAINLNNGVCFNNDKGKAEDTVTFTDDVNSLKYVQENIYETVSFSDGENTQTATINYYKVSVYEVTPVSNNGSDASIPESNNAGADNDIPDSETENDIDENDFESDEGVDQTDEQTDEQTDDKNTDYEGDVNDDAEKDGDGAGGDKLVDQYYACANNANVTYISNKAFEGNGHVTSINVSQDDLKKIGNYAFKGCSSLTSIEFGSKLSSIGREAFSGCNALSDVKFSQSGSSLKVIGDGAFAGCSFSEAILPDINNLDIGAGAFYACTHLGSIDSMFANFNSSGHKVYVGPYAFAVTNLTDVNMYADMISENNNSEDKADKKGYDFQGLFAGCTNLTRVALPANYGTDTYTGNDKSHKLGKYMFHKCPNLTRVKFSGRNAEPYDDFQFITESTLSYAKKYHKDHPDSMDYQNVTVASTFVIEGPNPEATEAAAHENARRYSNTYNYDYIDDDHPGVLELLLGGYIFNFSGSKVNGSFVGTVNEIIPTEDAEEELSLPADIGVYHITTIGDGIKSTYVTDGKAKQWENKLKILTIPESVIIVGNRAFSAASGLEKLYVNTNGVTIGDSAFENDAALIYVRFKQVTESDSPGETKIGAKCFKGCKSLLEVDFRDDLYSSDKIIDVNVTSIGNEAFKTGRNEMFVDRDLLEAGLNRLGSDVRSFEKGNGFWLIMKGKMDTSYEPYCFALGLNKTGPTAGTTSIEGDTISIDADIPSIDRAVASNKVSDKINSYITYASGNPENISARYNDDPAKGATGVALITYPSAETMVGRDDSGNAVKISNIINTRNSGKVPSQTEWDILHKLISITVPQGIELLDEAVNTGIGYEVYTGKDYLRSISGNTVYDGNFVHDINLNLSKLPEEEGIFKNDIYLEKINFEQNVKDLGTLPFLFDYDEPNYNWRKGVPDCSLHEVNFSLNEGKEKDATKDDPYFWCSNGIVYSYDGTDYTLEEVLYGRGNEKNLPDIGDNWISQDNDPDISKITKINESAFKNCPYLHYVDLTSAHGLETIPANCFNNDPNLSQIWLPESVYRVEKEAFRDLAPGYHVYFYGKEVFIYPGAITDEQLPTIHCHMRSSAEEYALANLSKPPVYFDGEQCEVFFYDSDM